MFYILCDIGNENLKDEDNIVIAAVRSIKNIPKMCDDVLSFVLTDYVDILETFPENLYSEDLGNRCFYLKDCAPLYWENVGYQLYYPFVKKKFSEANKFTKEMINTYNYCFPDLFSEKIKNRSELFINLSNMETTKCAYILGFPINKYIPSQQKLEKTLEYLDEVGIEKYCESIRKVHIDDVEIANPENVHYDKIEDFNTFDVVEYYTDNEDVKHLFRFTRPEFVNILKDEKNFYTGKKLPTFVLEEIKSRMKIAQAYNLPPSKTVEELLRSGEEMVIDLNNNETDTQIISDIDDDIDNDIDNEEEHERYVFGRLRNQETGEENFFRFPVPEEIDDSEADEIINEVLESRGLEYLGRIECSCPVCENVNDSEEFNVSDIESMSNE